MRFCVGFVTWQDGRPLVEQALDSVGEVADSIIVADGLVHGFPASGYAQTSDFSWFGEKRWARKVKITQGLWRNHTHKLSWLLEQARIDRADWLLLLAGDEELIHPHLLPDFLNNCPGDHWPIPFYYGRKESVYDVSLCPSKLVRPGRWVESVAGSNAMLHVNGTVYHVPEHAEADMLEDVYELLRLDAIPYLDHHPEQREEGRRELRFVDWEMNLDPLPVESEEWPPMTLRPQVAHELKEAVMLSPRPRWRCFQCGREYRSPGMCRVEHPASQLVSLNVPVAG